MKRLELVDVIADATRLHKGLYSYDSSQVFKNSKDKLRVLCPVHGWFSQSAQSHLRGLGCAACSVRTRADTQKKSPEEFISQAQSVHKGKYSYDKVVYRGGRAKVIISCPTHGDFLQTPSDHLSGRGCLPCSRLSSSSLRTPSHRVLLEKLRGVHGDRFTYDLSQYKNNTSVVPITCEAHGVFHQNLMSHLANLGCPQCSREAVGLSLLMPWETFISKANAVHDNKYSYRATDYRSAQSEVVMTCPGHGEFTQTAAYHISGYGCPRCASRGKSRAESQVADYFASLVPYVCVNKRVPLKEVKHRVHRGNNLVTTHMELDMFSQEHALAVEYHGLYWHREDSVGKAYHHDKLQVCKELGLDLIQVFEDEWLEKPEIVKSILAARVGNYQDRVYARKTKLREVASDASRRFYDANHIQGFAPGQTHLGLYVGEDLVAMASFGKRSHLFKGGGEDYVELIRFCNRLNTQVVGGLSKLLAHFRKSTSAAILSYCDTRLFNGKGYLSAGFELIRVSPPEYYYAKSGTRYSRFRFQKHKLPNLLDNFDPELSEGGNMRLNGYDRIYGCGSMVLLLK